MSKRSKQPDVQGLSAHFRLLAAMLLVVAIDLAPLGCASNTPAPPASGAATDTAEGADVSSDATTTDGPTADQMPADSTSPSIAPSTGESADTSLGDRQATEAEDDATQRKLVGTLVRLGVPHSLRLENAWSMVSRDALPPAISATLQANGLWAGELALADLPAFQEALGSVINANQMRLLGLRELTSVPVDNGRKEPTRAVIRQWSDGKTFTQPLRLPPGKPQLIVRATPAEDQTIDLELIPHFFFPKMSLFPRQPQEKALDGRIFSELTISHVLTADRLIVITARQRPRPAPAHDVQADLRANSTKAAGESADTAEPPAAAGDPMSGDAAASGPLPDNSPTDGDEGHTEPQLPPTLGEIFLVARAAKEKVRYVLIIGVRDRTSGETPPSK